jgi:hypothetical protein
LYGTQGNTELIKLDGSGNIQWNRTFPYAGDSSSMVQTMDGGFALVGRADNFPTLEALRIFGSSKLIQREKCNGTLPCKKSWEALWSVYRK